jgi:hypothetical protein
MHFDRGGERSLERRTKHPSLLSLTCKLCGCVRQERDERLLKAADAKGAKLSHQAQKDQEMSMRLQVS